MENLINYFSVNKTMSTEYVSAMTLANLFIILLFSVLTSLMIVYTYKKSFLGIIYQKSFAISLMIVCIVSSLVTIVISGNLALSLGMVGALSIIRFRTALKDPVDVSFLFWSVTAGIANGVAAFKISVFGSIFLSLIIFLSKFFIYQSFNKILSITISSTDLDKLFKLLENDTRKYRVDSSIHNKDGSNSLMIDIISKGLDSENKLISKIESTFSSISQISMLSRSSSILD